MDWTRGHSVRSFYRCCAALCVPLPVRGMPRLRDDCPQLACWSILSGAHPIYDPFTYPFHNAVFPHHPRYSQLVLEHLQEVRQTGKQIDRWKVIHLAGSKVETGGWRPVSLTHLTSLRLSCTFTSLCLNGTLTQWMKWIGFIAIVNFKLPNIWSFLPLMTQINWNDILAYLDSFFFCHIILKMTIV